MADSPLNAALRFEPDGYDMRGPRLMGRQSAGFGFLRAAVKAHGGREIVGYGPKEATAAAFAELVSTIDPAARTAWIRSDHLDRFNAIGVCHRPDHSIVREARLRLRVGPARHCLSGVTHSLSTEGASETIAQYLMAPLMPWDAVICTSRAALDVMTAILDAERDYVTWRLGQPPAPSLPQMPIIPLGAHCDDWTASPDDRARARRSVGLEEGEVAALYAGRLAIAGKAHPFAMLLALQAAAERTGKRVVVLLAGRFINDFTEHAYRSGAAQFCPDVRLVFVDGSRFDAYREAWTAADLFVSAADSIQETFGLTPVEAMAAGLPCVVSDWNGYRDTVRDGIDGFRVRTWAPAAGGEPFARALEAEVIGLGTYYWRVDSTASVDLAELVDRLSELIERPELRRTMGDAGRARAREVFDWAGIYAQHQALWGELDARRRAVGGDPQAVARLVAAPRVHPARLEAARMFERYATGQITAQTLVAVVDGASATRFAERQGHPVFSDLGADAALAQALLGRLAPGPAPLGALAAELGQDVERMLQQVAKLAKLGLLRLDEP